MVYENHDYTPRTILDNFDGAAYQDNNHSDVEYIDANLKFVYQDGDAILQLRAWGSLTATVCTHVSVPTKGVATIEIKSIVLHWTSCRTAIRDSRYDGFRHL